MGTVEIDESHLCSRKYGRYFARPLKSEGVWVFGGVCRETNERFCLIVENRRRETLFPIIKQRIALGTTIIHDKFAVYDTLESDLGFSHLVINHSKNFVDPTNKAIHTNKIELLWGDLKASILSYQGDLNLKHYVQAYVYRKMYLDQEGRHFKGRSFLTFLKDVAKLYPGPHMAPASPDERYM